MVPALKQRKFVIVMLKFKQTTKIITTEKNKNKKQTNLIQTIMKLTNKRNNNVYGGAF